MSGRLPRGPGGGARCVAQVGLAALLLVALAPARPGGATSIPPLQLVAGDRTVVAESRVSTATGFAEDRDAAGAPDLGPFESAAEAAAAVPGAQAGARAEQVSHLGLEGIEARGSSRAERAVAADPAFVVSRGESYFQILFQCSASEPLRLTAILEVGEAAGSDGFALLELGVAGEAPDISEPLDEPGRLELDLPSAFFAHGVVFELTALARADALDGPMAQSAFQVRIVPGPGAAVLWALVGLGILGGARLGRSCGDASS